MPMAEPLHERRCCRESALRLLMLPPGTVDRLRRSSALTMPGSPGRSPQPLARALPPAPASRLPRVMRGACSCHNGTARRAWVVRRLAGADPDE